MSKKRWMALLVACVMLLGVLPVTALAEDHVHSDTCYAKEGDLLCSLAETDGHAHGEGCRCPGGEYLCKPEEAEEHIHTDECICQGGELICLLDESDGHAHGEKCFAEGGELICGAEAVALAGEYDAAVLSTGNEYDDIKQLFADDENISFDPDTQTLLIIDVEHIMTEHLQSLGLTGVEDAIKWDEEQNGYHTPFLVSINDEKVQKDYPYYIVSKDTMSIEQTKVYNTWGYGVGKVFLSADNNKVAVLIVNQGDTYSVAWEMDTSTFYDSASTGDFCNGYGLNPFPKDHQTRKAYAGTAGNTVVAMPFSFEWDLYNWLDIEIWMAKLATKEFDNPGFLNVSGYVDFKIELRDKDGNITLLPKCFYNTMGSVDDYIYMSEDGIVSVPVEAYDEDLLPHSTPYGEIDMFIPFGYDYRISLPDYSVDALGAYAYEMNQEHKHDADGFCITDKSAAYNENNEWGSWLTFSFMPCTQVIRVEKTAVGNDSANMEYSFRAKQNVYAFSESEGNTYKSQLDLVQTLSNYPYDLYDSATGVKINTNDLKTDPNGQFKLKSGQYAEFKVWELPEDFIDYEEGNSYNFLAKVYRVCSNVETKSKYSFEELGAENCTTTITHKHGDAQTQVSGKIIENVLGSDQILFKNTYAQDAGSLKVSKTVSGNDADRTKDFTFTVTLSDTSISGAYGEMTFENGVAVFKLKANESKTALLLPAGITYTVQESDNAGYKVTVNGGSQTTATGTIAADTTAQAAFNNHKASTASTPGHSSDTLKVTVRKVWNDGAGTNRPSSIKVQLYKNGAAYGKAVVLNAENNWSHIWSRLDSSAEWTVDEVNIPSGYSKTVTHSGNRWVITNTLDGSGAANTLNDPVEQVPETGDNSKMELWIALACASMVLVAVAAPGKKHPSTRQ